MFTLFDLIPAKKKDLIKKKNKNKKIRKSQKHKNNKTPNHLRHLNGNSLPVLSIKHLFNQVEEIYLKTDHVKKKIDLRVCLQML